MNLILENPTHRNHALSRDGTLTFMPAPRLCPWPDYTVPQPWGSPEDQWQPVAAATIRHFRTLPPEKRYLQITAGLSRSIDRRFPGLGPAPTQSDILAGLERGYFAVDQDVALLSGFAKRLRDAQMEPHAVWIDAEVWPPEPGFEDITNIWLHGHGGTPQQLQDWSIECLRQSAVHLVRALGFSSLALVPCGNGPDGWHSWYVHQLRPAPDKTFTTIDASWPVQQIQDYLATAQSVGCEAVFVFADPNTTPEQLESLRPIFMQHTPEAAA